MMKKNNVLTDIITTNYNEKSILEKIKKEISQKPGHYQKHEPTALHAAINRNYFTIFQYLIGQGFDKNYKDERGHSPLYLIGRMRRSDKYIYYLYNQGAIVRKPDAVNKEEEQLISLLLKDQWRSEFLSFIAFRQFIIHTGVKTTNLKIDGMPILSYLSQDSYDLPKLKYLISRRENDINECFEKGSALTIALRSGNLEAVRTLITNGAKITQNVLKTLHEYNRYNSFRCSKYIKLFNKSLKQRLLDIDKEVMKEIEEIEEISSYTTSDSENNSKKDLSKLSLIEVFDDRSIDENDILDKLKSEIKTQEDFNNFLKKLNLSHRVFFERLSLGRRFEIVKHFIPYVENNSEVTTDKAIIYMQLFMQLLGSSALGNNRYIFEYAYENSTLPADFLVELTWLFFNDYSLDFVKFLFSKFSNELLDIDKYNEMTLLNQVFSSKKVNNELIKFLINQKCNITAANKQDLKTPLHYACASNNLEAAKALLEKLQPKDVNAVDASGCSPIYYATLNNNIKMIDLLVKKGANINTASTLRIPSNKLSPTERFLSIKSINPQTLTLVTSLLKQTPVLPKRERDTYKTDDDYKTSGEPGTYKRHKTTNR